MVIWLSPSHLSLQIQCWLSTYLERSFFTFPRSFSLWRLNK